MYTRGRQLPQAAFPTVWCCKSCSLLTLPCPHWPAQAVLLPTSAMPGFSEKDCSRFPLASTPWQWWTGQHLCLCRVPWEPPAHSFVCTHHPTMDAGQQLVLQSSALWEHHIILQRVKQLFFNLSSPKEQKHGEIILLLFQHSCFGIGMGFWPEE